MHEVNVDGKTCNSVKNQILNGKIDLNIFKSLESAVSSNITDTYVRLRRETRFKDYMKMKASEQKIKRKTGIM